MSSFGKKSYKKLCKYMEKGMSATFISKNTLAENADYHIHGGKGQYSLSEPLLVIVRPGKFDFSCDPDTHEITVRIPIQRTVSGASSQAHHKSKEDQLKIQEIRNTLIKDVLQDRIGLTLGGDTRSQGLVVLVQGGAYNIFEAEGAYWIQLNFEDDQNPLGARLVPRGGPYVPRSTGSTVETTSSSNKSFRPHGWKHGFSVAATYGSSDGSSMRSRDGGVGNHKTLNKSVSANSYFSEDGPYQEMQWTQTDLYGAVCRIPRPQLLGEPRDFRMTSVE